MLEKHEWSEHIDADSNADHHLVMFHLNACNLSKGVQDSSSMCPAVGRVPEPGRCGF